MNLDLKASEFKKELVREEMKRLQGILGTLNEKQKERFMIHFLSTINTSKYIPLENILDITDEPIPSFVQNVQPDELVIVYQSVDEYGEKIADYLILE